MAKPTNDFRVQITDFVDRVLDAEARGLGEDKQGIARAVLEKWAQQRHRAFKVYAKALRADGLQMELDGLEPEEDGARRK
jgi:hypothetical protein